MAIEPTVIVDVACDERLGGGGIEVVIARKFPVRSGYQEVLGQHDHRVPESLGCSRCAGDVVPGKGFLPRLAERRDSHTIGRQEHEMHEFPPAAVVVNVPLLALLSRFGHAFAPCGQASQFDQHTVM